MTAKQKATEMLENIDDIIDLYIPDADIQDDEVIQAFKKEFAILAINEIIWIASDYSEEKIVTKRFWRSVKKEINKQIPLIV